MSSKRKVKCAGCSDVFPITETSFYRKKRCCGKEQCIQNIDIKVKNANYIKQQKKKSKGTYRHGVPIEIKKEIIQRDGKECKLCYKICDDKEIQVHHIIPVSCGGIDDYKNLIVLCNDCHTKVHQDGWEKYQDYLEGINKSL